MMTTQSSAGFTPITDTPCPGCGEYSLEEAQQTFTRTGRVVTLMHCTNADCIGYHGTRGSLQGIRDYIEEMMEAKS